MTGKTRQKNKKFISLVVLGLVILVAAFAFWQSNSKTEAVKISEPLLRPVKTVRLSEVKAFETRSFPGLVKAASETKLAFRVGGPLIRFDVKIGQRVSRGDLIARIDPRDFEVRVVRLSAGLAEARANLKAMKKGARSEDIALLKARLKADRAQLLDAENQYARYRTLAERKIIAQSDLDHAKAAFDMAGAQVDAAIQELNKARAGSRDEDIEAAQARITSLSADLKAAKNALADTRLIAPFTGYVNRKYVENHENVKDGDPIVSLLDFSEVEVETAISEDLVIQRALFTKVTCTLDAYPDKQLEATLKEVGRKTDSANQSYPLTVVLHIPDRMVVAPGMAATVSIALESPGRAADGFMLPSGAVFADAEKHSAVWRIDPQTMRVMKIRVAIGPLRGDSIHVLSGLNAGDCVVTAGARFLRDGQEVRILDKDRGERL